jgi:hypothetical protein
MISNKNLLPSQQAALVAVTSPATLTTGAHSSAWVSMVAFEAMMVSILAGALGTNATLDAKLQQASDASGTGVKDIAGKAITQLTEAGGDSLKQAVINVRADDLDVVNGFTHIRLLTTIGVASSVAGAVIHGFYPHYGPASDNDASTVLEIVE